MFTTRSLPLADVSSWDGNRPNAHPSFQEWRSGWNQGDGSVAMSAEPYVPRGMGRDVGKLKRQVAHLEAAVKARDTALVESFAAMRHEMDQM